MFQGSPDGFHPRDVSVRLARPDELTHWDALMNQHHYLGFKHCAGRGQRYVFEWRGNWVGLAGWQSSAALVTDGSAGRKNSSSPACTLLPTNPFSHSWRARVFLEPRFLCACRDGSALER